MMNSKKMTFQFLEKFEKLLLKKLESLALQGHDDTLSAVVEGDRRFLYRNEIEKTFNWCGSQGIGYSPHLHRCLQLFDADKELIASVRVWDDAMGERRSDFYFIVPLDMAEKVLMLDVFPD